jgi:hypothetical protein
VRQGAHIIAMAYSASNGALSPRSFAVQNQRPRESFGGCSKISDYELLGKLGEGTFGYVSTLVGGTTSLRARPSQL